MIHMINPLAYTLMRNRRRPPTAYFAADEPRLYMCDIVITDKCKLECHMIERSGLACTQRHFNLNSLHLQNSSPTHHSTLYTLYSLLQHYTTPRAVHSRATRATHRPQRKRDTNAKSHGCGARIATKPAGHRDVLRGGCATASTAGACRAPSRSRRTDPLPPRAPRRRRSRLTRLRRPRVGR